MARLRIEPPAAYSFSCRIPVRITDLNYGGHVGNDTLLSIVHEARMQFLHKLGFTEMNLGGPGMIMADAGIEFKAELFYGDTVTVAVAVQGISRAGFDLVYKLEKEAGGHMIMVAMAKTGMVCYDYGKKKICALPEPVRQKLGG